MTRELEKQILVAGVGNAWLRDDAFGAEVARRLAERDLPSGVSAMDVGTSGLDLAYEVMRGYSALVIVDVSKQGGEPGTLYVIDVEPDDVPSEIEDGETIDPHSMDPMTMLRFVRAIGGWPGRVQVIERDVGQIGSCAQRLDERCRRRGRAVDEHAHAAADARDHLVRGGRPSHQVGHQ